MTDLEKLKEMINKQRLIPFDRTAYKNLPWHSQGYEDALGECIGFIEEIEKKDTKQTYSISKNK